MNSIFTYKDDIEGKIGIGKLPNELNSILSDISKEYYNIIPDKNVSTYHTWYKDMSSLIKSKVEKIQNNDFWNKLCDGSEKCIKINANEMDELYYSNPKNNLNKINLYGASGNYDIHKDCIYNFNGIKFYRIIIGLTDGNDNIITYFNNLNVGHKLNSGDYIVFDFDKTTHQVIKNEEKLTPRILLKIHYIVCENCQYTKEYIETIKQMYLYYEFITRYFMQIGTDPETLYEFFWGLFCQYYMNNYTKYIILFLILSIIIIIKFLFKIKLIYKNISKIIKYIFVSLIFIYLLIVLFYWLRYQILGIR
jgi:hypothetical protein